MDTLKLWHEIAASADTSRLEEVIAPDCVFLSPVVHTSQEGGELTRLYLAGAMSVFNESFRYVKEVANDEYAVLEFTCTIDGTIVNGVDILSFDKDGKIVEFKVMLRPLQAVNLMHQKMQEGLAEL